MGKQNIVNLFQVQNIILLMEFISLFIFLSYFHDLKDKKCNCSMNWKYGIIKKCIIGFIVVNLILLLQPGKFVPKRIQTLMTVIYSSVSIGYIIILGLWLYEMHKTQCKCTDDWRKTMLEVVFLFTCICIVLLIILLFAISLLNK